METPPSEVIDLYVESKGEDLFGELTAEPLETVNAYGSWGSFGTFGSAWTCASSVSTGSCWN